MPGDLSEVSHARVAIIADVVIVGDTGCHDSRNHGGLPAALASLPDPRARRGVRHRLPVVVCAAIAGYRSYAAIAERIGDVPTAAALALGIDPARPSEAMIHRLPQALDPDQLTAVIGG
jgi:hypothetical protein